jgi:hypothetical protein
VEGGGVEAAATSPGEARVALVVRGLRVVLALLRQPGSDFEKPAEARADEGRQAANKFGCFNCHGP